MAIAFYQTYLSGIFGGVCRFEPSCSEYARQCFVKMSFVKACLCICKRLLKCQPFGPCGFDPCHVQGQGYKDEHCL